MGVELTPEERDLLLELLEREHDEVRTEIRHTKSHDYKDGLKERERRVHDLIGRLKA